MSILSWIILGALAGWTASALTDSRDGILMDFLTGVAGALIAGFAAASVGNAGLVGLNLWSLMVAVTAAVFLILAVPALREQSVRNRA
ncbi:MAG: GlsB/YeaQ/YmgE family stress response membrane protein [Armatimonadota bacterium]